MSKKTTKETIAYLENSEYWARVTPEGQVISEPEEVNVIVKKVSRNGFAITYLSEIISMIETIGNKKMQVVKYILQEMDKGTNKLTQTVAEIAKGSGVSRTVVIETLQLLEQYGFIARKTGVIMLSPKIAHKGNWKRERYLMSKFVEMDEG